MNSQAYIDFFRLAKNREMVKKAKSFKIVRNAFGAYIVRAYFDDGTIANLKVFRYSAHAENLLNMCNSILNGEKVL